MVSFFSFGVRLSQEVRAVGEANSLHPRRHGCRIPGYRTTVCKLPLPQCGGAPRSLQRFAHGLASGNPITERAELIRSLEPRLDDKLDGVTIFVGPSNRYFRRFGFFETPSTPFETSIDTLPQFRYWQSAREDKKVLKPGSSSPKA